MKNIRNLLHGKELNRTLNRQKQETLKDKIIGTAACLLYSLVIAGGVLYGIKTYPETPEYQTGIANHTDYEQIVAEEDSVRSEAK